MSMQMRMMQNFTQRMELIQELGLSSRMFQSTLVRTEKLLQTKRAQCGLRLVQGVCATMQERGKNYRGVIDFLVAMSSPQWDVVIQDYYDDASSGRLIENYEWETIELMDHALCALVRELMDLHKERRQLDWLGQDVDDKFWDHTIAGLIRNQMVNLMPRPQLQVAQAA